MIFSRTPKNKWITIFYLTTFIISVILIFEQLLQLIVAQLIPDIYSVLPITLDIFFTEQLSMLTNLPSWIFILIIICILIGIIFFSVERLAQYNERLEELFIGDTTDRHLYMAVFTRPEVKYQGIPLYTGEFMRDNKGTRADERTDAGAGELYKFMHASLFSLPLDEVYYLKDIANVKEGFRGTKFTANAVTNKRNLLVKKHKKFLLSKRVNDYHEMKSFIISLAAEK